MGEEAKRRRFPCIGGDRRQAGAVARCRPAAVAAAACSKEEDGAQGGLRLGPKAKWVKS
jgi:hypothetical protein